MASTLRTPPRFVPTLTTVLEIPAEPVPVAETVRPTGAPVSQPRRRTPRAPWRCRLLCRSRRPKSSASKSNCCTACCSVSTCRWRSD